MEGFSKTLNQSNDIITIDCQEDWLTLNGNRNVIHLIEPINNILLNGSENNFFVSSLIQNLIINGCNNQVNFENYSSFVNYLVINGSHNTILFNQRNSNCMKINNGQGNNISINEEGSAMLGDSKRAGTGVSGNGNGNVSNSEFSYNCNSKEGQDGSTIFNLTHNNTEFNHELFNSFFGNMVSFFNEMGRDMNINLSSTQNMNSYEMNTDSNINHSHQNHAQAGNEGESDENYRRYFKLRKKVISHLPKFKYSHYIKLNRSKQETCSICLDNFKKSDQIIEFACENHIYHKACLREWIKKSNTCPLCKYDLMSELIVDGKK